MRWKKYREQVLSGQIRPSLDDSARSSMLEEFALKVGDSCEGIGAVGGLGNFPNTKPSRGEKRAARVLRCSLENRASGAEGKWDDGH